MSNFKQLYELNLKQYLKDKQGATYLSWSKAWAELKKVCPDATYVIKKDEHGRCWFGDSVAGYMVYTEMTINGLTYEMWLPVMDHQMKSMKDTEYEYSTKKGPRKVEQISTMEINKAVMRCLVKNMAMFGLALYVYEDEDFPTHILGEFVGDDKVDELIKLAASKGINAKKLSDKVIDEYSANLNTIDQFIIDDLSLRIGQLPDK